MYYVSKSLRGGFIYPCLVSVKNNSVVSKVLIVEQILFKLHFQSTELANITCFCVIRPNNVPYLIVREDAGLQVDLQFSVHLPFSYSLALRIVFELPFPSAI